MLHRAIGIKWLKVAPGANLIGVALSPPARMLPRQTLTIPVSLSNIAPGEEAYVAVAAVDVGILNSPAMRRPTPMAGISASDGSASRSAIFMAS